LTSAVLVVHRHFYLDTPPLLSSTTTPAKMEPGLTMATPTLIGDTPKRGRSADDIGVDQRLAKRVGYVFSTSHIYNSTAKLTRPAATSETSTTPSLSSSAQRRRPSLFTRRLSAPSRSSSELRALSAGSKARRSSFVYPRLRSKHSASTVSGSTLAPFPTAALLPKATIRT
jgi:hypothetical protein